MKKNLFYLFALICTVSLFTACSDDDEPWKEIPQEEITVGSGNATLQINGETSKTGSVKMTVKNESEATLEMKDVIPGYSNLNVEVELQKQADNSYKFAGTAQVNTAPTTRSVASEPALLTVEVDGIITLDGKVNLNVTATGAGLFVGTYSDAQLALKYSDADLAGKTVYYTITENVPVLTLVNVIPGEQATAISGVYLDKNGAFSGEFTSSGAAVTYSGAITAASGMTLNVKAVLSADAQGGLTTNWSLMRELFTEHATVRIVWTVDGTSKIDPTQLCYVLPCFLSSPLAEVLKDITLTSDGNLMANYYSKIIPFYYSDGEWHECKDEELMGMPLTAELNWLMAVGMNFVTPNPYEREWQVSPKNLIHWYAKDSHIYLIPNIAQIVKQLAADQSIDEATMNTINSVMTLLPKLAEMDDATLQNLAQTALGSMLPGVDLTGLDAALIRQVLGWLTDGIPLKYKAEGGYLYLYADKDMMDPFMKLLIPLLPTLDAQLGQLVPGGMLPSMLQMLFNLQSLTQLGEAWNSTTAFELGINFLTE